MRIIVATNNAHKLSEIREILGEKYQNLLFSMKDFNIAIDPDENGSSFKENASIKAKSLYNEMLNKNLLKCDDYIVADDTGLCIDYLNGAPGLISARYMGKETRQEDKNIKILELMKDVKGNERKAYFITILSVIKVTADSGSYEELFFEGKVDGYIADSINGTDGFGYDPIFAIGNPLDKGIVKTYSSIGTIEKNKISHRARAFSGLVGYLENNHNI